ncbi:uncharacterized protein LOC120011110 [Tripterygium wilfordii]|uniref:uncharacterized protein LOC120011110 n=1 Tax=Tripterygium wilfordii TaxID=458696 RepID=UPI0018F7E51E|nr:uncharacterized protein LOC120011110 [Tripterygium wilfordii]
MEIGKQASLLSHQSSPSRLSKTLLHATEILSGSGYLSMALTPTRLRFLDSPSLSFLQFHFSPFSPSPGTKIPTLLYDHELTVTSSPSNGDQVSVNGVKINGLPIYNGGSLVNWASSEPTRSIRCAASVNSKLGLKDAVATLRSRGYSFMASFLIRNWWVLLYVYKNEWLVVHGLGGILDV